MFVFPVRQGLVYLCSLQSDFRDRFWWGLPPFLSVKTVHGQGEGTTILDGNSGGFRGVEREDWCKLILKMTPK